MFMNYLRPILRMGWRQIKLFLVLLLGYLVQVCVMPYLKVGGITPNIIASCIALITVGYGRLRALWAGLFYGILLETFLASVPMMNLLTYPVSALLCSVFFADKTATRIQHEQARGKTGRNVSPLLRTVLCAAALCVCIEIVNLVYASLSGASFTMTALGRALTCILSTAALTALIMIPVRRFMGFRKQTPKADPVIRYGKPMQLEDK